MLELFQLHSGGKVVLGDISEFATLKSIFEAHPYSCVLASGIACQPYSHLGDQRSGLDPRASTLHATLAAAFYLRAMIVVIECVGPAQSDPFVQHHIKNFCFKTGFCKSECVMDLKEIWASKRNRWWCVLSAPAIGKIDIGPCTGFPDLPNVGNIIPKLCPWPSHAENELALTPVELEAFMPLGTTASHHMLNTRAPMACALHCWGSQLMGCPCGCRETALSKNRLDSKGLFGVVVEGVQSKKTRHLHPQEAGALCGSDPGLQWGNHNRLALGAVGQLASPLQALWIFSHILKQLQAIQHPVAEASPTKMMMAYRSWLLARCVKQWGSNDAAFLPTETLDLSSRWMPHVDLSFSQLLERFPSVGDNHVQKIWETIASQASDHAESFRPLIPPSANDSSATSECPTDEVASLGEGIDHGLTLSQVAIDLNMVSTLSPPPDFHEESLSTIEEVSPSNTLPASVSDHGITSSLLEDVQLVVHGDSGEIDLSQSGGRRANFRYGHGSTIENLIVAETALQQLVSSVWEVYEYSPECFDHPDSACPPVQISVTEPLRPGMKCKIRGTASSSASESSRGDNPKRQRTEPIEVSHDRLLPPSIQNPLEGLKGDQFLKLLQPVVSDPFHAESLLTQKCPVQQRQTVLNQQLHIWADDEIRWHLVRLQGLVSDITIVPIDPLLMHGWIQTLDVDHIAKWLQNNAALEAVFITVVHQDEHWFPLFLDCRMDRLLVSTWDIPTANHVGLQEFCQIFAVVANMELGPITQHSRFFAGDGLCGAASIAYLEHRISGSQLPEFKNVLESLHQHYRLSFSQGISVCSKVCLPWLWGAGVDANFEQVAKDLAPLLTEHGVPSDAAYHRAVKAVKAIGVTDVQKALSAKAPWKTLKTLGTNVKFQFILPDELQAQIARRAGKEAVGKPKQKGKSQPHVQAETVVLDPTKLSIPEGSFVGGGKAINQIPLPLLGPLAEGIVIATWEQAEPYLRSSQLLTQGPLAMLVLQGPVGGCQTSLSKQKVTVPARCSVNNEPLLLEAFLVQLGGTQVSRAVAQSPVPIDTVKVATLKLVS